jgi:hypothetical protein
MPEAGRTEIAIPVRSPEPKLTHGEGRQYDQSAGDCQFAEQWDHSAPVMRPDDAAGQQPQERNQRQEVPWSQASSMQCPLRRRTRRSTQAS